MKSKWKSLGWRHPHWELVRYFCSLRASKQKQFVSDLKTKSKVLLAEYEFPVAKDLSESVVSYLEERKTFWQTAEDLLRTEDDAISFCKRCFKKTPKTTNTKSADHHQSSKALVLAVSEIAEQVCDRYSLTVNPDPQTRCVFFADKELHVTARNLDGAVPTLLNPTIVWEIKEYWGATSGGSKMSDAVYECALVGRELREYEETTSTRIVHVVFVDGKQQWSSRKSDLCRFYDLYHQGLIDALFVGVQVESEWESYLSKEIKKHPEAKTSRSKDVSRIESTS
jgi:hypothetical protein